MRTKRFNFFATAQVANFIIGAAPQTYALHHTRNTANCISTTRAEYTALETTHVTICGDNRASAATPAVAAHYLYRHEPATTASTMIQVMLPEL